MENDTDFGVHTCVHFLLSFPVSEHKRETVVELVDDL